MKRFISMLICLCVFSAIMPLSYADTDTKTDLSADKSEYVRLAPDVTQDMQSAGYWLEKNLAANPFRRSEYPIDQIIMSYEEILEYNRTHAEMIWLGENVLSLWEIGSSLSGELVRELLSECVVPGNPDSLYLNGQPTNAEYWIPLRNNLNLDAIGDAVNVRYGYSVKRATTRLFPSNDFIGNTPEDRFYDAMLMSEFMPFQPVAVLQESLDGKWFYILTYGYGGWVEKENVALCSDRESWLKWQQPDLFLTVTGRELRLADDPFCPELSGQLLPMGTKLPLVKVEDAPETVGNRQTYGNYIVKLPVRQENGSVNEAYALIPVTEDVCVGTVPYTRENEIELAFKLLGDRYGWGGMFHANDCSGIIHEIFSCFGFVFPRTAVEQVYLKDMAFIDVSEKNNEEKLKALDSVPIGSFLYFQGHIMIYLGKDGGVPYTISAVGSFASEEMAAGNALSVNSVVVNALDIHRRNGESWLTSIERILIPEGVSEKPGQEEGSI